MTRIFAKAGFFRHFLSGFALGAIGLVAVQTVHADPAPATPPSHVTESAR